jgi:hypothetical protein
LRLDWQGDAAKEHVRGKAVAVLAASAVAVAARARELISIQGPPRSAAGNPPHMDSGRLHASVTSEVNFSDMRATVGSDEPHALHLEIGTSRMAPRPWLRRAVAEASATIGRWRDEGDLPAAPGQSEGVKGFAKRVASKVAGFFGFGKK